MQEYQHEISHAIPDKIKPDRKQGIATQTSPSSLAPNPAQHRSP